MAFSDGYGFALGEKVFRVGHMSGHDVEFIKAPADVIKDVAGL